jgi:hypothetical protein
MIRVTLLCFNCLYTRQLFDCASRVSINLHAYEEITCSRCASCLWRLDVCVVSDEKKEENEP